MTSSPPPTPETGVPVCYRHPDRESHICCQRCSRPICPDCMRDAAVGFQCPSCVAEGRKTTRAGRTAYGGLRPTDASRTSFVLIGINVVVWVLVLIGDASNKGLLNALVLRPRAICDVQGGFVVGVSHSVCSANGGSYLAGVRDGAYWQLVTSMFSHEAVAHIGFNMLALYVLGPQLELAIGRARFIALYLISGLAGSALVYWAAPEYSGSLGASGAIFGLMGALLVIAFKVGGDVRGLLTWIGFNFFLTIVIANISWQAHVGGFLGGLALGGILAYAPKTNRTQVQVFGMSGVLIVIVIAIVARSAVLA